FPFDLRRSGDAHSGPSAASPPQIIPKFGFDEFLDSFFEFEQSFDGEFFQSGQDFLHQAAASYGRGHPSCDVEWH
ncbi:MAG: hypothetical protein GWM98_29625, partial [Nitrospinaceae bacterium]|nr:hypothetical protein [Nitrospinaceae bacterium]